MLFDLELEMIGKQRVNFVDELKVCIGPRDWKILWKFMQWNFLIYANEKSFVTLFFISKLINALSCVVRA